MANRYDGEVAAPEFGAGYTIRLDMRGQGELESKFGEFIFINKLEYGLAVLSSVYLEAFLAVALRKDGEVVKELPEVPPPLAPIAERCLDALALFRYGKLHKEWITENEKLAGVKRIPKANPTKGTTASQPG